jgi:hypothetical protein
MATQNDVARARREGTILGIPFGDLGWFASLLIGVATGMAAFFLTTFAAIIGLLCYQAFSHQVPQYDRAYRDFGFPVGVVVMASALTYLAILWSRRMIRKRHRA